MVNRRSVMKIGAATVAGALVNLPVPSRHAVAALFGARRTNGGGDLNSDRAFARVVFDERFAECRAFAAELHSAGVPTSAIRGDVAGLWYGDLRAHLRESRPPVAGLTDRAALFCLEELARDVGMRVIFRADHTVDPDGHARHSAVGTASLVAAARQLTAEPGFGRALSGMFSRFDTSEPRDSAAQKRTGPFSPENKTALVSWIIA